MKIAIITGASSGMGREFVYALDKQQEYDEMWLIARRKERLEELQAKCRNKIRAISLDLSKYESIEVFKTMLDEEKPEIKTLVNAAGYGKFEPIDTVTLEDSMGIMDLNIKATMAITQLSLPLMKQGAEVYIIASLSSFQPTPYMIHYSSSKAAVLSYSRGLNAELAALGRGIKVMAVCPLWVATEFFDRAREKDNTTVHKFGHMYKPEEIVVKALKDMKKGKDMSICGMDAKLQVLGVKLLPHKIIMKIWMNSQK